MKSIISSHNKQILIPRSKQAECTCCKVMSSCQLDNKYLTSQLIYLADTANNSANKYDI